MTAATGAGLTIALRRVMSKDLGASLAGPKGSRAEAAALVAPPAAAPPPPPPPPLAPDVKPATDVFAGAMARAASQSTIHPLDTMKVRMQAGAPRARAPPAASTSAPAGLGAALAPRSGLSRSLGELKGLYRGVFGAASGAGIIIGTYFAFYSTAKRLLKQRGDVGDGAAAFLAGAAAATGSSVVKVPLAVCIRSVQAGVYRNVGHAARSIVGAAGVRGLFTGFVPTILEDVPDMAVKFAVYEMARSAHARFSGGRPANVAEDLVMGGVAGAAAAAATTPLDVVKTVMMCSASSRPTLAGAARSVMREGHGLRPFFRGVGPRALSNGLNSAIFFCFFEAIRHAITAREEEAAAAAAAAGAPRPRGWLRRQLPGGGAPRAQAAPAASLSAARGARAGAGAGAARPAGSAASCLSLALPPPPGWA